jgi:hypothetical protein
VGPLVQSKVGKALALAATAWVALNVSQPLALFLAVLIVSCCSKEGMYEYLVGDVSTKDKMKKPADEPKMPSPM